MIKTTCPSCKKTLGIPDQFAGKKIACPACKKPLAVPSAPPPPPPVPDVDALAVDAFRDEPKKAEPVTTTIDFKCPMCDEPIKVSTELAGKQTPCPECRRIVKVPLLVKKDPMDWRKAASTGPSLAKRDDQPAPEGAWGSATTASRVSRDALLEADAIPEARVVWTLAQKIKAGVGIGVAVLAVSLGIYGVMSYLSASRQDRAMATALALVKENKVKPTEAACEAQRAAGEMFSRAGNVEKANEQFRAARAGLAADTSASLERDFVLIELGLGQLDLGGDKQQIEAGTRIKWEDALKETRQSLQNIRSPEAMRDGLRLAARKLQEKGQGGAATPLIQQLAGATEAAEILGAVGLDFQQSGKSDLAADCLDQALPLLGTAKADKSVPFVPSVVALALVLEKRDRLKDLLGTAKPGEEPPAALAAGQVLAMARKGDLESARKAATGLSDPTLRLWTLLALAEASLDAGQGEAAKPDLETAIGVLENDLKGKQVAPWLGYRLVQLGARAGLGERTARLAAQIPDAGLRGRAQLEILRAQLAGSTTRIEEKALETVGKDTPTYPTACEALARHTARVAGGSTAQKMVGGWNGDTERALGSAGVALGMQDAAVR